MRLERRNSPGFIEPDVFIELPWQHRFEVMAGELAFGPINHPNGPLKPRLQQAFGVGGLAVAQTKHKMRCLALVADPLDAFLDRRPDILDFHGPAPLGGSRHGTVIGAKTNRIAILTEFLAAELTDIVLTTSGHFGGFGIADVGIVRPNNAFAMLAMVGEQGLEGVEHMLVA